MLMRERLQISKMVAWRGATTAASPPPSNHRVANTMAVLPLCQRWGCC